jgi:hypothetical protein
MERFMGWRSRRVQWEEVKLRLGLWEMGTVGFQY